MSHISTSGTTRNPLGSLANLDMDLDSGYPHVITVLRDGALVEGPWRTLRNLDAAAELNPGEWKVHALTPLWDATWRREASGRWICIEAGMGFA